MAPMSDLPGLVLALSAIGIAGGLAALVRGFRGYRRAILVGDTPTSRIASLAVGGVQVSGSVEPAELTLVSPLQARSCVYFRAKVVEHEGRSVRTILHEEHGVGFKVRDPSGSIRVFPRGATWDVPAQIHDRDGLAGDPPPGLSFRSGPEVGPAAPDREEQVARLLTVQRDAPSPDGALLVGGGRGRREYEEARIEVGDTVTVVGTALPFDQLEDPDGADHAEALAAGGPLEAEADPEIAADLEAARATGTLVADSGAAWGNAAIPGFGIGRPVRPPHLDPAATPERVVDGATAERYERTFEIAPEEHVLAAAPGASLLVSLGAPAIAVERGRDQFVLGLLGAALAIGSAVVLVLDLGLVR